MIFGNDRRQLRKMYADAWRKHCAGAALSPLDAQLVDVIGQHPEYHEAIEDLDEDFSVEEGRTNPFLHMGLHLGLREQVATDRPPGIRRIFEDLAARTGDPHQAEHRMIDCLAETLWDSQRLNQPPDERAYLERLRRL